MTPVSDFKKMSLLSDSQAVTRSQSDTSYEGLAAKMTERNSRRGSEYAAEKDDKKLVLRPLQLNGGDPKDISGLLYRRMSRHSPKPSSPTSEHSPSRAGVSRSYSVKSVKKFSEARHRHRGSSIPSETMHYGGVKVKERSVSNRSLPLPGDESDYMRLRNFSVTSKGVINRGDSFRSKSSSNVPGLSQEENVTTNTSSPTKEEPSKSLPVQNKTYKVLLLGGPSVGKTAMRKQFMTSEYICAYDLSGEQEIDRVVTIVLNNEESQMEFEEETIQEGEFYSTKLESVEPDAFVIVYSVTDRRSYSQARHLLSQIEAFIDNKAIILVGNKNDLARLRVVSTDEGKALAKDRGCKFIETSVAINHQVDELLVGTLTQIRIKAKVADKLRKKRESQGCNRRSSTISGSKASGVLKKILRRACLKSKSCDNLHVL